MLNQKKVPGDALAGSVIARKDGSPAAPKLVNTRPCCAVVKVTADVMALGGVIVDCPLAAIISWGAVVAVPGTTVNEIFAPACNSNCMSYPLVSFHTRCKNSLAALSNSAHTWSEVGGTTKILRCGGRLGTAPPALW